MKSQCTLRILGEFMKKLIIILCVCLCFALMGCLKGKKVVLTDSNTKTELTITEDGVVINGTLPVGNGVVVTVTEEE